MKERIDLNKAKCIFCGGQLSFDGDEMASHVHLAYDGDKEAVIYYVRCKQCGRDYEIVDPTKDERGTDYKDYWQNTPT